MSGLEDPVYLDRIHKVSPDGRMLRTITVLDLLYENGLERHIARRGKLEDTDDVTHLNDIEPLSTSIADVYTCSRRVIW